MPLLQLHAQRSKVTVVATAAHELRQRSLQQWAGFEIHEALHGGHRFEHVLAAGNPSDAQGGEQVLRHRRHGDRQAARIHRTQGRQRVPATTQRVLVFVFDNGDIGVGQGRSQLLTLCEVQRTPGRVVERRHQVAQPHRRTRQHALQVRVVETIRAEWHLHDLQTVGAQQAVHVMVGRRRHHHRVTRRTNGSQHQVESLLRAGRHQQTVGRQLRIALARALDQQFAKLLQAKRRVAIAEQFSPARLEHRIHRGAPLIDREARIVRRQFGEVGDQLLRIGQRWRTAHRPRPAQCGLGVGTERTALRVGNRAADCEHNRAATDGAFDQTKVCQPPVGFLDRGAGHLARGGDFADRWQTLADQHPPILDRARVEAGDLLRQRGRAGWI